MPDLIDRVELKNRLKWGWVNGKFVLRTIDEMPVVELNPYGGFIEWQMQTAPEQVIFAAVTERLIKAGVLMLDWEETPLGTKCYWKIKAVKMDEEEDDETD